MTDSQTEIRITYSDLDDCTESEFHRLLSATQRRQAIDLLTDRSPPVSLEDLARAMIESEDSGGTVTKTRLEQTMVSLHHRHLPMMDEVGVITYDIHERQIVSCPSVSDTSLH